VAYLKEMGRNAAVSPTISEITVVMDADCESQDTNVLATLTADLSRRFSAAALSFLNHDDEVLLYELFQNGESAEKYNSVDTRPADDAGRRLAEIFGKTGSTAEIGKILYKAYLFEVDRHSDLVKALGLSPLAVGIGFNYLKEMTQDELPEIRLFRWTESKKT
jgi:hypothetical protein